MEKCGATVGGACGLPATWRQDVHAGRGDQGPFIYHAYWCDEHAERITEKRRVELWQELQELVVPLEEHPWGRWAEFLTANPDRVPGTQSRWSQGKDLSFTPLRPERVVEVAYDHMEGRRFRHTAQFRRWRTDRTPQSCTYDQLDRPVRYDLASVLR